ncbi:putative cyclin domain-containing protein [Helianthus annuus]|uniref:Cyclin n=1 Tax=Helianthus annuus TaxID=4232 RepID=A0A251RZJ7_HELAN|nr:cyclin-D5-1 [Helianthus annuus]KAF5798827.1 putative cyclin [Helianthus annuus]KAJ0550378.1 putative cyclin domain-containing protein [Helianthus annuus]KAJ0557086.1 putative cyclin domain-containing protein [Helianthus annuus]KAJ0563334.1 putative cyclin domain-containing protein [Helianthus annuus]KAJ0731432.1 putative cyclin domain-containing protein [Helianthus annuus]
MDPHTTFSLPNLLCEEDDSSLNDTKSKLSNPRSEDDHYIRSLIEKEAQSNDYNCVICDDSTRNWFKCARLDAIDWIFSTREVLGFHFRTAYLSLTYFDRFNSRRVIDNGKEWAIQLLGIACLSLAAKMEEQVVPSLSHYKAQGYNFESSVIQRMELMVLATLEWRLCCITPFAYLHHFLSKICDEGECNEFLVSKAIALILDFSKEVNSMDHRPSVVAIAAVLLACDDQLTRNALEFKIGVVSSLHSLEKECIYSCYNLLKNIETKKNTTPESNSFELLTNHRNPSSNIGIKRKLTYNGFEQKCPLQKISRRL